MNEFVAVRVYQAVKIQRLQMSSLLTSALCRNKQCACIRGCCLQPGRVAQSVEHLTRKSGVPGSIPGLATYFRFSFRFSRRAVVSYWRKYVHEVLVNRLGGLSLPRKSVVRLTDRPDMTDIYRGRKTTMQCNICVAFKTH